MSREQLVGNPKVYIELDKSLDLVVEPVEPIAYELASKTETLTSPIAGLEARYFKLVVATAIPIINEATGEMELVMIGSSHADSFGDIKIYAFNPLDDHTLSARRIRQVTDTPYYASGVKYQTGAVGSDSLRLVIY